MLAVILTVGSLLRMSILVSSRRRPHQELEGDSPKGGSGELGGMRDAIDAVSGRVERLEEERDFYKDLLDAPGTRREIRPSAGEEDASDPAGPS